MPENPATVAVVVVNYRTPDLVIDCLASLQKEARSDLSLKVHVGDAESGDGSVEIISTAISNSGYDNVNVFDIGRNAGFAFGNNYVVETWIKNDPAVTHVYFLNPDTYVRPGAVRSLVEFLDCHPCAAVAGSRLENPDGSPRAYAFRFPAPWREFFRGARLTLLDRLFPDAPISHGPISETRIVDWVTGASFMMPRRLLEEVGGMDPDFFLYFEEVDYQSRIRDLGYEIWHVADSRVVHLAGASTGVRVSGEPIRLPAYWYQSRFRFFSKRYGVPRAFWANILFLAGHSVCFLHRSLRGLKPGTPPYVVRDMFAFGFGSGPGLRRNRS